MNTPKTMTTIIAVLTIFATQASGDDARSGRGRGNRQGPPPEAYTACEDKSAGDDAEFVGPNNETVTGTCEEDGDLLVLRPDRSQARSGGRQQGPPPEAYTACEDKSIGDEVEFVAPNGETVTGTCEENGDDLVLRPDTPPQGRF